MERLVYVRRDAEPKKSGMRRCLGPGQHEGDEHVFRSPDPSCFRICNACKKKLAKMGVYLSAMREVD